MTIMAANITLQYYMGYKSDIEFRLMDIGNRRQVLAYKSSKLAEQVAADPEAVLSEDPTYLQLAYQDKVLEQLQKTQETQHKTVSAQIDSVQKLLDNNIKKDFTINWGGGG